MVVVRKLPTTLLFAMLLTIVSPAVAGDLSADIDAVLADKKAPAGRVGVHAVDARTGRRLYARNADELFVPASNQKLLTTAAALDLLGADFTFITTFALRGQDLVVIASGDPGLGDPRLAKRAEQAIDAAFVRLAEALKQAGRPRIAGDLVVDATVFGRTLFHPNWPADQAGEWYAAEVAGLNFNNNCVDIRLAPDGGKVAVELTPATDYVTITNKAVVDSGKHLVWFQRQGKGNLIVAGGKVKARMWEPASVPVHDPTAFTARVIVETLKREGVELAGRVRFQRVRNKDGTEPADLRVVARHEQPIGPCLWRANTHSQNFFAEALFKALGAYRRGTQHPVAEGTWDTGRQVIAAWIKQRGLAAPRGLAVDDGSGLSKKNKLSPHLLTDVLRTMAGHEASELWLDSLATGGVDGTLRRRFRGLADEDDNDGGRVHAKTGTLSNASALSGYVETADGGLIAFSILHDNLRPGTVWQARRIADRIVRRLAEEKPGG